MILIFFTGKIMILVDTEHSSFPLKLQGRKLNT